MAQHGRSTRLPHDDDSPRGREERLARLDEHAAQASALLAQRAGSGEPQERQGSPKSLSEFVRQNIGYIISAIVVIAVVTGGIFAARAFLAGSGDGAQGASAAASVSESSGLEQRAGGKLAFASDAVAGGGAVVELGIDLQGRLG